jgi:hypothetical protein
VSFGDREFRPKYFGNYAALFGVDERKDMRAALTQPIMLYIVDSASRIR